MDYIIHVKCLTELFSQFVLYITRRLFANENLLSDFENLHTQAIRKIRVAGKKQKQVLDTLHYAKGAWLLQKRDREAAMGPATVTPTPNPRKARGAGTARMWSRGSHPGTRSPCTWLPSPNPSPLPSEVLVPENQRLRLSRLNPHGGRPCRDLPVPGTSPTRPYEIYLSGKPTRRAGRNASWVSKHCRRPELHPLPL